MAFEEGEYYHVFNRGVEKRDVFSDGEDLGRFLESMEEFNSIKPIGSIYEKRIQERPSSKPRPIDQFGSLAPKTIPTRSSLVEIICYCLNPNHFHLLLKQCDEFGIQKYMQRLGTGYTNYFNEKNKRSGSLFQGTYKAVHIESNEQLLHTSVYVNLNNKFGSLAPKLSQSSWNQYMNLPNGIKVPLCSKEVILEQFGSIDEYKEFATSSFADIVDRKQGEKDMKWLLGS